MIAESGLMIRTSVCGLMMLTGIFAQSRQWDHPVRQAVRGTHGAVAAGSEYATEAGMRMYYKGGNAVDVGRGDDVRGFGHRAFALRDGRRSADPDPHEGRQGLRDRRRRHDAEAGDGRNVPHAPAASWARFWRPNRAG